MSRIETSMNQRVSLRDRGIKSIRESVQNPETCWIILFIVFGCLLRLLWAEDMKWKEDEIREWIECYSNLQLLPGQLEKIPRSILQFTNGLPGASEAKLLRELENLAS